MAQLIQGAPAKPLLALADSLRLKGYGVRWVQLPKHWWENPGTRQFDAGLFLAAERDNPDQIWQLQHANRAIRIKPCPGDTSGAPAPDPAMLNPLMLSLLPAREQLLERIPQRKGSSVVLLLQCGCWLSLPWIHAAAGQELITPFFAGVLAIAAVTGAALLGSRTRLLLLNSRQLLQLSVGVTLLNRLLLQPSAILRAKIQSQAIPSFQSLLQHLSNSMDRLDGMLLAALIWIGSLALLVAAAPWTALVSLITQIAVVLIQLWLLRRTEQDQQKEEHNLISRQAQGVELFESFSTLRLLAAEAQAWRSWHQRPLNRQHWPASTGPFIASISAAGLIGLAPTDAARDLTALLALHLGAALTLQLGLPDLRRLQRLKAALPRAAEHRLEIASPWQKPAPVTGTISFEAVSFRHDLAASPCLHDISFTLQAGTCTGLIGPSSSGKSTLLSLLQGLVSPCAGRILIDGDPCSPDDLRQLTTQFGVVPQHNPLLGTTIGEAIAAGRPLSEVQIWTAVEQAALSNFLRALPLGLDTPLPGGGASLSGGERQRICIARALAASPAILLMDEATSALDPDNAAHVMRALASSSSTRIVSAHRLDALQECKPSRVLVLNRGRLVDDRPWFGTHPPD